MEIIRTKRASSAAAGSGAVGQPKSKYRKRSRATPPGKCHSCNIRETPEWRRGPDGARTLCNACGLHYAKLMRKRDKAQGTNGDLPRIDLDTLRASARASDTGDKARSSKQQSQSSHPSDEPSSSTEQAMPPPPQRQQVQQHHQGSFLVMMAPDAPTQSFQEMPSDSSAISLPGNQWARAAPPTNHGYAPEPMQHQSYMRSSQPAPQSSSR